MGYGRRPRRELDHPIGDTVASTEIVAPFQTFRDVDGTPLDAGYIYIGVNNLEPIANPLTVYWDAEMTIQADQPIRTIGGYPSRAGSPAKIFTNADYSITVKNSNGTLVPSILSNTSILNSDALIAVKQPFTNAVARTQHDKNIEMVSVKDFGALGDNATDDTAAIQAAITWCVAQNKGVSLYFPRGIYRISATIDIPLVTNFCLMLVGDGFGTQIKSIAGGINLFYIHAATPQFGAYYTIRDIAFTQPVGGGSTGNGISALNANTLKVENCWFFNQGSGIVLNACYAPIVDKCYFYGCASNGITTFTTGTNGLIIRSSVFNTNGNGVNLTVGGNNITICDSDFEGNSVAIGIFSYTSVEIKGCYFENGTSTVFYFGGTNHQIDIIQNWFGANAVATPLPATIIGGTFRGNTLYAAAAQSCVWSLAATDFLVGNNYAYGAGTVTPPVTGWTAPVLNAGFTNQGGLYVTAGYFKGPDGFVRLQGNLLCAGAPGAAAFTLPAGYRPATYHTFVCGSSAGPGTSIIEVRTNGDVWVLTKDAANGVGINGIKFQTA